MNELRVFMCVCDYLMLYFIDPNAILNNLLRNQLIAVNWTIFRRPH